MYLKHTVQNVFTNIEQRFYLKYREKYSFTNANQILFIGKQNKYIYTAKAVLVTLSNNGLAFSNNWANTNRYSIIYIFWEYNLIFILSSRFCSSRYGLTMVY